MSLQLNPCLVSDLYLLELLQIFCFEMTKHVKNGAAWKCAKTPSARLLSLRKERKKENASCMFHVKSCTKQNQFCCELEWPMIVIIVIQQIWALGICSGQQLCPSCHCRILDFHFSVFAEGGYLKFSSNLRNHAEIWCLCPNIALPGAEVQTKHASRAWAWERLLAFAF